MSPKGEKLAKFFSDLAKNPAQPGSLYQRYLANPEAVMKEEGLADDVIQAVMNANLAFINDLLRDSNFICGTIVHMTPTQPG